MPEHLNFNTSRALNRDKQELFKRVKNVCNKNERCTAFIVEWSHEDDYLFGIGCDRDGGVLKLKLNAEPGLFVACADENLLKARVSLCGYRIQNTGIRMSANNFSVFDYMLDESVVEEPFLIKIYTKTFENSIKLYNIFSNDPNSYQYAAVPHYWDISKQIVLELYLLYREPKFSTFLWIDNELTIYDWPQMRLNRIIYDIETVSSDPVRVPTGEKDDDIFFSVSIIDLFEKRLYSAVYLPIDEHHDELKQKMLMIDTYCSYEGFENIVEVFNKEIKLLKFTMNILRGKGKLHFSDGFNNQGYDIKFLFLRCKYYNLQEYTKDFIWDMGFRFGINQIPFDLYRASRLLFDVKSYSLNNISKHVLDNETKLEAVNSVDLRYLFYAMKKHNRLYSHEETLNESWPSLRDAIHYNNLDTILVCNIIKKTECSETIIEECNNGGISIFSLLGRYDQSKYKVLNKCFFIGLRMKKFLCRFKSTNTNAKIPYYNQYNEQDACNVYISLENKLHNPYFEKPNGYPGGFNFCLGEYKLKAVQIYDLYIAYMYLIVVANISDETAILIPANIANLYRVILQNPQSFKCYDYLTHTGINATENKVLAYKYIYENLYCGGEFPFTHEELASRGESLIILILNKSAHEGVLSCIVDCLNTERENYKLIGKMYDQVLENLKEKLCTFSIKFRNSDSDDDEEDDSENSEDEKVVDDDKNILFKHDNLIIKQNNTFKFSNKNINKNNYIEIITNLINIITIKMQKSNDMYRLRKTDVSSVYGCIGALNFSLAALITCLIRSSLISISQYITEDIRKLNVGYAGPIVCYNDTDSIMLNVNSIGVNETESLFDFSSKINSKFPLVQIKLKATVPCFLIQTKIALYKLDGVLKYGQNKNGPSLWRDMVHFFYNESHIKNFIDIEESFVKFYKSIYEIKDLNLFCQIINIRSEYKNECPANVLKKYIAKNYPTLSGMRKQKVYYYLDKSDFKKTVYKPFCELTPEKMKDVNLFKFFNNNFKTISHFITLYVHENNQPFNVTISKKYILIKMLQTFITTYCEHFKTNENEYKLDEESINQLIEETEPNEEE